MKTLKNFLEQFSPDQIQVANKTARNSGAVGAKAITPRHVDEVESQQGDRKRTILDFGSGPAAQHTQNLLKKGYNVTAHEFGGNQREGVHDPNALSKKYDHVFASNVLNTQSNKEMLGKTLDQIHSTVKPGGMFTGNFPESPRKAPDITHEHIEGELKKRFHNVERVKGKGTKKAPLFHATHPKEDYQPE
jgi:hypothetical protein